MKTIIAGNWKMNLTIAQSIALAGSIAEQVSNTAKAGNFDPSQTEIVVAPTALALYSVSETMKGTLVSSAGRHC